MNCVCGLLQDDDLDRFEMFVCNPNTDGIRLFFANYMENGRSLFDNRDHIKSVKFFIIFHFRGNTHLLFANIPGR